MNDDVIDQVAESCEHEMTVGTENTNLPGSQSPTIFIATATRA